MTPASKGTADDDDGAYDPTEHFDFGDDEDESWFLPDDAMPRVAYEIIDVAANIAEKEAGGTGDIRDESKRQDYHDLAAYYHTQATTIGSFQGREDLHPDGACEREIKQLCAPDAMVDAHLSNVKFTETVALGVRERRPASSRRQRRRRRLEGLERRVDHHRKASSPRASPDGGPRA